MKALSTKKINSVEKGKTNNRGKMWKSEKKGLQGHKVLDQPKKPATEGCSIFFSFRSGVVNRGYVYPCGYLERPQGVNGGGAEKWGYLGSAATTSR